MHYRFFVTLALAGTITLSSAAFADKASRAKQNRKDAEKELATYASCVSKERTGQVNAFLREAEGTTKWKRARNNMSAPTCLSSGVGELRIPEPTMRQALYEALYDKSFGSTVPVSLTNASQLDFASERVDLSESALKQYVAFRSFGDCIARRNPNGAHTWLQSPVYSKAEGAAVSAVQNDMNECLVANSSSIKFSRTMIRGIIAEAMYKLRSSFAPAPSSA